jgi:hypothetical protein
MIFDGFLSSPFVEYHVRKRVGVAACVGKGKGKGYRIIMLRWNKHSGLWQLGSVSMIGLIPLNEKFC